MFFHSDCRHPPTGTTSVVWTPDIFTSQLYSCLFFSRSMANFQTLKAKKEVLRFTVRRSELEILSKLMILFLYTWWIILCWIRSGRGFAAYIRLWSLELNKVLPLVVDPDGSGGRRIRQHVTRTLAIRSWRKEHLWWPKRKKKTKKKMKAGRLGSRLIYMQRHTHTRDLRQGLTQRQCVCGMCSKEPLHNSVNRISFALFPEDIFTPVETVYIAL